MEQNHFSLLPAALAVAAALAAGTAQGATVHFDNPSRDFTTSDDGIFLATGDSTITAKDIALDGKSISASLSEDGELGAGSLTIKADNAQLRSYGQSVSISSTPTSASFTGKIDLTGNLTVTNGLSLSLQKNKSNPIRPENTLSINAASVDIKGYMGLGLSFGAEGGGAVPDGLLAASIKAEKIQLEGGDSQGLYVDGNSLNATENQGTRLTLEANQMKISGGGSYGGTLTDNTAIFVAQGAELNLIGQGEKQELTISPKQVNSASGVFFENTAILNTGGNVLVRYGEGSRLKFNGGIANYIFRDVTYTGKTTVEVGAGSKTELEGVLGAINGPLTISIAKGTFRIETSLLAAQNGTLTLDLETGGNGDTGLLTGLLYSSIEFDRYGTYGEGGTIDVRLSGPNNHMVAMTQFTSRALSTGKMYVTLNNGAVWDLEYDEEVPDWVNRVTTLTLNKGTLNLPYGNSAGIWGTVRTETFGGAGGTVNFNLILNSSEEKNDHLLIGKMKEGDHTVHVEAHSGFEPVDMQGYLIRADEWQGGTFTADTNPLEAGVYLYSYTVAHRPGEEEGQTDWYLTFGTYVPPAPDPDPEPDPGPGPQPEPKPEPTPQPPLSPSGEAVASLAGMGAQTAMYLAQLSDVRKRLGEVRRGAVEGLWASVGGSGDHISGFRGTGFKQDAYRFNFGFDRKTGEWLLGGTLKAMTADQKTRGTQFRGDGDAHSEGFNLYATWTGGNGSYADFVAGLDHYHEKLSTHMLNGLGVSGAYRNIGLGLSAEVGHQFMSKDAWFIEPQAQLSYYRLWGDDFALSNGMKVSQKNFNGLTGRLGLASGKEFRQADGTEAGQLYARLGIKHELMGDQEIRVNGIRFKDGLLGTRFYYGLGAEWLLAKNMKVFGHVERENGSRYTREFDFNLGVKYAF